MTPPELKDLVRRLLACEAIAGKASGPMESAALRVYERLRQSLDEVAGTAALRSLALRALVLAKAEAPRLEDAQVAADGSIKLLSEFEHPIDMDMNRAGDEGIVLVTHLLGLLLIFLGEALTFSLLRTAWPGASFDERNPGNGRKA
jgi:hypothetical protein